MIDWPGSYKIDASRLRLSFQRILNQWVARAAVNHNALVGV
jgi:hypothetical protein